MSPNDRAVWPIVTRIGRASISETKSDREAYQNV
jgi:hypothetical protein